MNTLSAKYFRNKVTIQQSVQTADGYGGFTNTYQFKKEVYAYVYNKTRQVFNSTGQRIIQQDKAVVIRKTELDNTDRFVIDDKVYSVIAQEENLKGTQIELTLEYVGFGETI